MPGRAGDLLLLTVLAGWCLVGSATNCQLTHSSSSLVPDREAFSAPACEYPVLRLCSLVSFLLYKQGPKVHRSVAEFLYRMGRFEFVWLHYVPILLAYTGGGGVPNVREARERAWPRHDANQRRCVLYPTIGFYPFLFWPKYA